MKKRFEECIHPVYQTIEEIGDGDKLMLCPNQHNRGMPKEISTGNLESHFFKSNGLCMTASIEEHLDDVFMHADKEMKHRMDALGKKGKRKIIPLTKEYVHCCEAKHKIILEEDGAYEGLTESLMNFWESSNQQENMLIRNSMGDVLEINELCISAGITRAEPCKVSLEVNEETKGEYPCVIDMDQIQKSVLGLKNGMTWYHGDKQKRTLAYVDSGVADREGKKFVMTQEETILSQRGDQYLKEFAVAKLINGEKEKFSNFRNYNEELTC